MIHRTTRCITAWSLCAVALLSAQTAALAQDDRATTPQKASPSTTPKQVAPIEVIGAYRPVDPSRAMNSKRPSPPSQTGLDLYLGAGAGSPLVVGQVFEVFRTITPAGAPDIHMTLKVGTVEILSIQGPLAVGRVVGGPSVTAHPHLRTPGILVGDFVRPNAPISGPGAQDTPSDAADAAAVASRPPDRRRRKRRRRKRQAKTGPEPCPNAPEELLTDSTLAPPVLPMEALPPDPDSFKSWNAEPIDF
ncbi:MAG: hypothetical protein CMH57_02040 [Myxococcales bacterium]|nr:hypothetical protein [Myxococcales bacterium]